MGLTNKTQQIKEDATVFGQIYFEDTVTDMYNAKTGQTEQVAIAGKTIVVDPQMFLLRNLGSVNNTIIHECIHWEKHRKVFELEKIFNDTASWISCEVVGDVDTTISKKATEMMEYQANQLASRIQIPQILFV